MNAWKNLLEQDKRKGEIYDEKIKKEERNYDKEKNDDQEEEEGARERLGSGEEFLTCQPNQKLTHDEKKKVINSVKLTKALVLLGYNCWSELEPGINFQIIKLKQPNFLLVDIESNDLLFPEKIIFPSIFRIEARGRRVCRKGVEIANRKENTRN